MISVLFSGTLAQAPQETAASTDNAKHCFFIVDFPSCGLLYRTVVWIESLLPPSPPPPCLHQQASDAAIETMVLMPQHQGMIATSWPTQDN